DAHPHLYSFPTRRSSDLPTDFQQGEAYRIIFIHVPAAWMGMFLYVLMAIYAGIGWAFNARLASMMATAISTTGAIFTFISLVTRSEEHTSELQSRSDLVC